MQEGQQVVFIDRAGVVRSGRVAAVLGSGPSGYKTLNIALDTADPASLAGGRNRFTEKNVPHANDREQEPGRGFWLLPGDPIPVDAAALSATVEAGASVTAAVSVTTGDATTGT